MPERGTAIAIAFAASLTAAVLVRASPGTGAALRDAPAVVAGPAADDLRDRLATIFDTAEVNALWAAKVVSLDTGEVIFERNPRLLVMPASTMKIVTLAVAADRLGWDARFSTRLESTGAIEEGVLRGDLIVTGDGDPTIGERADAPRVLHEWAGRLAVLGVTRVEGRLIGDDDVLPDQALGAGWAWDDLAFGYAAPLGALQYHESAADIVITAGPKPGTPATVRIEPASTDLVVTGRVSTTAPDVPAAVYTRRRPFTRTLEVTGSVPKADRDYVRSVAVDNPTRTFLAAFRDALARAGITVTGGVADVDEIADEPPSPRRVLHTHESPPLREIGVRLMKVSQNLFAETLLSRIGLGSDVPDPDPLIAARGVYERTLARWGVPVEDVIVADGSGLSRYDYVTAAALVTVLTRMAQEPRDAAAFEATMPIMGIDGTLERRLRNTPLQGRIRAKTGTISNVRALAGYMTTGAGERLAFAIIANNFKARASTIDVVVDRALLALLGKDRVAALPR
jgi:D-alanyl-D-alanine carboxypeptidase/D-alanyl-D-alanine-endopeptidase (penicillin-binding protein 4)